LHVDPNNSELIAYVQQVAKLRQQGLPTIPTTIKSEMVINPFLRVTDEQLINNLQSLLAKPITKGIQCFKELRIYKDNF